VHHTAAVMIWPSIHPSDMLTVARLSFWRQNIMSASDTNSASVLVATGWCWLQHEGMFCMLDKTGFHRLLGILDLLSWYCGIWYAVFVNYDSLTSLISFCCDCNRRVQKPRLRKVEPFAAVPRTLLFLLSSSWWFCGCKSHRRCYCYHFHPRNS